MKNQLNSVAKTGATAGLMAMLLLGTALTTGCKNKGGSGASTGPVNNPPGQVQKTSDLLISPGQTTKMSVFTGNVPTDFLKQNIKDSVIVHPALTENIAGDVSWGAFVKQIGSQAGSPSVTFESATIFNVLDWVQNGALSKTLADDFTAKFDPSVENGGDGVDGNFEALTQNNLIEAVPFFLTHEYKHWGTLESAAHLYNRRGSQETFITGMADATLTVSEFGSVETVPPAASDNLDLDFSQTIALAQANKDRLVGMGAVLLEKNLISDDPNLPNQIKSPTISTTIGFNVNAEEMWIYTTADRDGNVSTRIGNQWARFTINPDATISNVTNNTIDADNKAEAGEFLTNQMIQDSLWLQAAENVPSTEPGTFIPRNMHWVHGTVSSQGFIGLESFSPVYEMGSIAEAMSFLTIVDHQPGGEGSGFPPSRGGLQYNSSALRATIGVPFGPGYYAERDNDLVAAEAAARFPQKPVETPEEGTEGSESSALRDAATRQRASR